MGSPMQMFSPVGNGGGSGNSFDSLKQKLMILLSDRSKLNLPNGNQTPIQDTNPSLYINPIQNNENSSYVTPIQNSQDQTVSTPIQENNPGILNYFGNPDYTGQHGFPEKPTGLGGLRPLGGISANPNIPEKNDPGAISLEQIFGENGLDYIDLLVQILGNKQRNNANNNPWGL